jgi:hypothetical protein
VTTTFIQLTDVVAQLNATGPDANNNYTVYGLIIAATSFQAHVDFANLYANAIVGQNLSTTDPRYNWAVMVALNMSCLRILVAASGGMLLGSFNYRLGDIQIERATIGKLAFSGAVARFEADLLKALTNFTTAAATADMGAAGDVPTYRGGLISP